MFQFFARQSPVSIEPFRLADAAKIAAIHSASFVSGWTESDIEAFFHDRKVCGHCAAGPDRNDLRGFAISKMVLDEAELLSIAVDARFREKKIGRLLLSEHIAKLNALAVRHVFLEVAEDNIPAFKLYKRLGFVQIGRRESYYPQKNGSRIAALTMQLDIL
jgi:ribosomal-protein-alanine N-acetyltransferase